MSAYEFCKQGCVLPGPEKGCVHRAPIDCTTYEDLMKHIETLADQIKGQVREIESLKAKLYDFEHDRRDY